MAKLEKFQCSVCGHKFDSPEEANNEIAARNGKWRFFADDVCSSCVGKVGKLIEDLGGELKQENEIQL